MRLTNVLSIKRKHGHNLYRIHKYMWYKNRNRLLVNTKEKDTIEEILGAVVQTPDEVLSKPYSTPRKEDYFPPAPPPPAPKENLFSLSTDLLPMRGFCMPVFQNLFTTVVSDELPQKALEKKRQCSPEELELFSDCILSSHLLDAHQEPLPKTEDFESSYPVRRRRRDHGIPLKRKNELLTLGLAQCFDSTSEQRLELLLRPHFTNTSIECSFRYGGDLVQLLYPCPLMVSSSTPLDTVIDPSEIDLFIPPELDEKTKRKVMRKQITVDTGGPLQQALPEIFPLSALSGARIRDQYSDPVTKSVCEHSAIRPHTVYIHNNDARCKRPNEDLTAITLMNLFAHAASYAIKSGIEINSHGHLAKPVTVQGVHSKLNLFQPAVFQLHTLGPMIQFPGEKRTEAKDTKRTIRNVFFYQPFTELYKECSYNEEAKPAVTELNDDLISTLRALHER